jgi:hypothetical protein
MGATIDDPPKQSPEWRRIQEQFKELRVLVKRKNVGRWTLRQVVDSYTGRLRRRYEQALTSLEDDPLGDDDAKLSGFLKGEKFNPTQKLSKPRLINPRSPRYNLVLASYLKPLEHALWTNWKVGHLCPGTRVSGKGLNLGERAALIQRKMDDVGDCVVVEVDGKTFEAHVSVRQLKEEHSVYKAAYPGDKQLSWLLSKQLELKGKTACGIKYRRPGCRASGDYNTGLGNTMVMGGCVITAMRALGLSTPWTVMADGDNCLLFIRRQVLGEVQAKFSEKLSGHCGQEMTIERPAFKLEEVTFGQCRPVRFAGSVAMVRDPFKVLSGCFTGYRHYHDPVFAPRLLKGVAMAELSLSRGLPVLGPYFEKVCSLLHDVRDLADPGAFLEGHLLHAGPDPGPLPITMEARVSFSQAWDIGVGEQLALESHLLEGLERDFVRVVETAEWLHRTIEVRHGTPNQGGENTGDHLRD